MVRIATDPNAGLELRGRMNAELAQYVYPKRKAVEVAGDQDAQLVVHKVVLEAPHSRGLRIAVQKEGRALSRCEVVKLFAFDVCDARLWGFICFSTGLHFVVLQKRSLRYEY
jgi:hypothetical protein